MRFENDIRANIHTCHTCISRELASLLRSLIEPAPPLHTYTSLHMAGQRGIQMAEQSNAQEPCRLA